MVLTRVWTVLMLLTLTACGTGRSDASADIGGAAVDSQWIAHVREVYGRINGELPRYSTVSCYTRRYAVDGATCAAQVEGDMVRRVIAGYRSPAGYEQEDFYFDDQGLVFVLRSRRKRDGQCPCNEERFYLRGERLVRWLGPDGTRQPLVEPAARWLADDLTGFAIEYATQARATLALAVSKSPQQLH